MSTAPRQSDPVAHYCDLAARTFADELTDRSPHNIGALVDKRAASSPHTAAVLWGEHAEHSMAYGELAERSSRLGAALESLGVARGDRVAVCLPQSRDCATVHAAVLKAGAISMPVSRLYGLEALSARFRLAAPRVAVCEPSQVDLFTAASAETSSDTIIVATGEGPVPSGTEALENLIKLGDPKWQAVPTSRDDPALLLFTSGTSGAPKGVLHAHRVVPGHAASLSLAHNIFPRLGSMLWTPADWSWAGGLVNCLLYSWYAGVPIVCSPDQRFDANQALRLLSHTGASAAFVPPTALKRMRAAFQAPVRHLTRLTSVMTGSESLDSDLLDWSVEFLGVVPNEVYGQTEASAIVGNCSVLLPIRPGSIGVPYPGSPVNVVDEDGQTLAPGVRGELAVRSSSQSVFLGYWRDPESTAAKFIGPNSEWMRLGDTGTKDEDGYLWFHARRDDVINSAGYRIGPSEVERCLRRHNAVFDAAVVGLPDSERGAVVAAFIELREGECATHELQQELTDLVAVDLAPFQRPRRIQFVDALPRTVTGKVQRAQIREDFCS